MDRGGKVTRCSTRPVADSADRAKRSRRPRSRRAQIASSSHAVCSAQAARDFTRTALHEWGAGELLPEAAVVISELVTNAVRYGCGTSAVNGGIELVLLRLDDHIVCV